MEKRNQAAKLIIGAVVVIIAVLFLAGIVSQHEIKYKAGPLSREDISYLEVEAPAATAKDGTIPADAWKTAYPDIVLTMKQNAENDEIVDYLELDPYLVEIYEGFGFAKEYGSARGHEYTLDDVANTARPHPLANCLTCKTPNFAKLVQDQGVSAYKLPFDDVLAEIRENGEAVSCYTCHGNDAGNKGEIVITHTYVEKALGANAAAIDPATLSCGQCHIEYYFTPEDKETMMPYHSVAEMTPEAIYDFYTALGYTDWTQESTGAKMLKVQHPEMETYLQGPHASELNCADCHMPVVQNDETQNIYHSHYIVSPLEDKALLATCVRCHGDTDMVTFVQNIQSRITAEETRVGNLLAEFKKALAAENQSGTRTDEQLDPIRELYRKAQWFFDFCYVENAEGAHNSALATRCLETAENLINEGMQQLAALGE
ncbi:MAG: ammonia-forming cytochrome c nitrite reductase subunit c552 [Clostridia bacterium]|nr:ammonia-forming cytochrome c nitrite reductase subunit c552 [Clostridia bacterium]